MPADDWIAFWNSKHFIYVNDRHLAVHYRRVATDILPYISSGSRVLDFGCGEALAAGLLLSKASRVFLCDAAPNVRASLSARFRDQTRIQIISPDGLAEIPRRSIDLIVMHSVAQYLTSDQLISLLIEFRGMLKTDGRLILGDVISSQSSALVDALSLFEFSIREGFFLATLTGLARTAFSRYSTLRSKIGVLTFRENEILTVLANTGYAAVRSRNNLGHNKARTTFIAKLTE